MRGWRRAARAASGAGLLLLGWSASLPAATCDEYNPAGPAHAAQITLTSSDAADESGDELRSFVATGSLGKVAVTVISATPPGIVGSVSAVPDLSGFSPHYGERLKGIAVTVRLKSGRRQVTVVVRLRQVCAQYFRNTFLYY
jgi:hypothetical protein